ncbi:MAG TPA: histidinol-phosphate transaminase [Gemmatimonadaceae bacterium]|nr:histidinol-phosphate transaminase [Gemmatimonadaceae bacterium]
MIANDRSAAALARAAVRALPVYSPDTGECEVDVSENTNLWGTPPAALQALADAPIGLASLYPSLDSAPFREAVLDYLGLFDAPGIGVVAGCGSDDVLDAAIRAFGASGDEIVFPAPTFVMIPILAQLNGLTPVGMPFTSSYGIDPDRLVDRRAKITYLCTPNNPTSTPLPREVVEYVVERAEGLVIVDEAYAEFAPETFVSIVTRSERVLVTRTFSKAFGMAGLRIGYGVGSIALVDIVARARGPYKVNVLAERAAMAALREGPGGRGWVLERVRLATANRDRLATELRSLGLPAAPAAGNFVFVPTPRASSLARAMRERGVLVRALEGLAQDVPALRASGGCAIRIGVGPWDAMARVLDVLGEVLPCA